MSGDKKLQKRARHARKRKEKQRTRRRWAQSSSKRASNHLVEQAPVVRAYVPDPDVWRATGYGTAGVVRQLPNGYFSSAFFLLNLNERGLHGMFGKDCETLEESDEILRGLSDNLPPTREGPVSLAAEYAWGAKVLAEREGNAFPTDAGSYFALLPRPLGSADRWIQRLIGTDGLAPPTLWETILVNNPNPDDIPEGKEVLIATEVTFDLDNPRAACAALEACAPNFVATGVADGDHWFEWTRALPRRHASLLSRAGGREQLGTVQIGAGGMTASAMNLSFAGRLIYTLKQTLGEGLRMRTVRWHGQRDAVNRIKRVHELTRECAALSAGRP